MYAEGKDWPRAEVYANATQRIVDSLDARALLADAAKAQGRDAEARAGYQACLEMYRGEVAKFDELGKGGPLRVRPIDRQFATFCERRGMFVTEGLVAARRDFANRPDAHAKAVLAGLTKSSRLASR
jgi:hypothetical protein